MGYVSQLVSAMRPLWLEAIGTLLLVVINTSAILTLNLNGQGTSAAVILVNILAMAIPYGWLIYIWGSRNSGYFNPAVTLWLWLSGRLSLALAASLVLAQLAGAIVGSIVIAILYGSMAVEIGLGSLHPVTVMGAWAALVAELIGTVCLLLAFRSQIGSHNSPSHQASLIALGVMVGQFISVGVSGGALNPARAIAPQLVAADTSGWWLYWVGPILAAVLLWAIGSWATRAATRSYAGDDGFATAPEPVTLADSSDEAFSPSVQPEPEIASTPAMEPIEDSEDEEAADESPIDMGQPVVPSFQPEESVEDALEQPDPPQSKRRRQAVAPPAEIKFVDFDQPVEPLEDDEQSA